MSGKLSGKLSSYRQITDLHIRFSLRVKPQLGFQVLRRQITESHIRFSLRVKPYLGFQVLRRRTNETRCRFSRRVKPHIGFRVLPRRIIEIRCSFISRPILKVSREKIHERKKEIVSRLRVRVKIESNLKANGSIRRTAKKKR